jgi:hypothetical protein
MTGKALSNCGLTVLVVAASMLLALATGCSTTKRTQHTVELLMSSGFKVVAATTPAQQTKLQTLRPGKITPVKRDGKTWYIYPDAAGRKLYVGNPTQYQNYRQALEDDRLVRGQYESIQLSEDSAFWSSSVFGDFGE